MVEKTLEGEVEGVADGFATAAKENDITDEELSEILNGLGRVNEGKSPEITADELVKVYAPYLGIRPKIFEKDFATSMKNVGRELSRLLGYGSEKSLNEIVRKVTVNIEKGEEAYKSMGTEADESLKKVILHKTGIEYARVAYQKVKTKLEDKKQEYSRLEGELVQKFGENIIGKKKNNEVAVTSPLSELNSQIMELDRTGEDLVSSLKMHIVEFNIWYSTYREIKDGMELLRENIYNLKDKVIPCGQQKAAELLEKWGPAIQGIRESYELAGELAGMKMPPRIGGIFKTLPQQESKPDKYQINSGAFEPARGTPKWQKVGDQILNNFSKPAVKIQTQ